MVQLIAIHERNTVFDMGGGGGRRYPKSWQYNKKKPNQKQKRIKRKSSKSNPLNVDFNVIFVKYLYLIFFYLSHKKAGQPFRNLIFYMLIYEKLLLQENMGKGGCFLLLFFPPKIEERRKLTQLVFPIIFFFYVWCACTFWVKYRY